MTQDALIPAWVDGELVLLDKLDVHRRGLRHPAVSVFVLRGREVLIQQRAAGKYHTPGLWANTCCTHPHWGEAAAECARRRLRQELGIDGLDLRPVGQVEYRADVAGGLTEHEVVEMFRADVAGPLALSPDPDEVQDTAWVDLDALAQEALARPGRYTPWLRIYLAQHAHMLAAAPA